jgi:ATP-dependent DNA ligase
MRPGNWLDAFNAAGVEGLVVKGASTRYQPARREWVKVNSLGLAGVQLRGRIASWRGPM